jgi:hypothetical protein
MGRLRLCLFSKIIVGLLSISLLGVWACERQKGTGSESKTNAPPVITLIKILPENPHKESELNIHIKGQDPDGDPVTYHYQWIKNDIEISGETKGILKSGVFKKGDLIRVRVIPSDGKVNGNPFLSDPVKILNTPPEIQEVWIEPKRATSNDPLRIHLKAFDRDGDFIYYTYQWEKNGTVLFEDRGEVLDPKRFKKGDSISVTVTPDDRDASGVPRKSPPMVIANSPPTIVSSPPTNVEGDTYLYQVKANDPDQDTVFFSLKSGPRGMEINKNTGLLRWEIKKEAKGVHSLEIEVSDQAGAKTVQQYTVTVEFK